MLCFYYTVGLVPCAYLSFSSGEILKTKLVDMVACANDGPFRFPCPHSPLALQRKCKWPMQ